LRELRIRKNAIVERYGKRYIVLIIKDDEIMVQEEGTQKQTRWVAIDTVRLVS